MPPGEILHTLKKLSSQTLMNTYQSKKKLYTPFPPSASYGHISSWLVPADVSQHKLWDALFRHGLATKCPLYQTNWHQIAPLWVVLGHKMIRLNGMKSPLWLSRKLAVGKHQSVSSLTGTMMSLFTKSFNSVSTFSINGIAMRCGIQTLYSTAFSSRVMSTVEFHCPGFITSIFDTM